MQQTQTQGAELVCPFHGDGPDSDCGFKTQSEDEYGDHSKSHRAIHSNVDTLVRVRVAVAKDYAGIGKGKDHPVFVASHLWADKPADMQCATMTSLIQDMGITDQDNFVGLSNSTSGHTKRSKPYHNPFKRARK